MKVVSNESGFSGTLMLMNDIKRACRRATDGMLSGACGMGILVGVVGRRVVRAVAVAFARVDDGPAVCGRRGIDIMTKSPEGKVSYTCPECGVSRRGGQPLIAWPPADA